MMTTTTTQYSSHSQALCSLDTITNFTTFLSSYRKKIIHNFTTQILYLGLPGANILIFIFFCSQRIQRNLGVVIQASVVHVFMGGPTDPPSFLVDGYTQLTQAQFTEQAVLAITEGLGQYRWTTNRCFDWLFL